MTPAETGRRHAAAGRWAIAVVAAVALAVALHGAPRAAWAQKDLFVTNFLGDSVAVLDAAASGTVVPRRTLAGPSTGLSFPAGVAVDPVHGELVVANLGVPSITCARSRGCRAGWSSRSGSRSTRCTTSCS
jgi:hypothetical protein